MLSSATWCPISERRRSIWRTDPLGHHLTPLNDRLMQGGSAAAKLTVTTLHHRIGDGFGGESAWTVKTAVFSELDLYGSWPQSLISRGTCVTVRCRTGPGPDTPIEV